MPLTIEQLQAQDKQVGKCMEELERIQMDPVVLGMVKQIVRRRMRFCAENVAEARNDT